MKKYICIIALLVACLVSCGSTEEPTTITKSPTITSTVVSTSESVTKTTTAEIPPATTIEPPTEPETNELLFEEQGVEIYYQGIDKNVIHLLIVNPFEHDPLNVCMQNIIVNGFSIDCGSMDRAEANSSIMGGCVIPLEELQSRDITRINELKFTLHIYIGNGEWVVDTDELTIVR